MSAVLEPTRTSAPATSASKPWLKHYPPGVPAEINPDQYRSLPQFLDEAFKAHAQKTFAVCMDVNMRYRQLDELSASFGAWLQAQGLAKGARVALMLPNLLQFPVVMAGILRAGYTCVNVNPLYTPRELEHQLKDSGAEAIIILENFCATLAEVVVKTPVKHVVVASVGDMLGFWKGLLVNTVVRHVRKAVPAYKLSLDGGLKVTPFNRAMADGYRLHLKPADCAPGDIAFLQYTGGTTGLSKGAVLTHRNVLAAVLSAEAWFEPAYADITQDGGNINGIAALPLYHIFALSLAFLAMRGGNMITMIPNPRDVGGLINELKKRPFHTFPGVNTLFNALLAHPDFNTVDWSKLRVSQAGGMAASEGTATKWAAGTGCNMIEGWGMSETVAIGTNNPVTNKTFTGTIGLPLPSVEIAIKDDDGHDVALGQPGEICIKGPNVMQGYYNKPEENKNAFTADGFMRTGDIGIMDERGYTKIVDRKKDMILVSGFNVFPNELENVISTCPGVLECAAIGVPDEKQGEAIKVFVVKSDAGLSEEQVASFCRKNLTGYKQPKYIEFRDDLPKTNVGKILRRELRDKK